MNFKERVLQQIDELRSFVEGEPVHYYLHSLSQRVTAEHGIELQRLHERLNELRTKIKEHECQIASMTTRVAELEAELATRRKDAEITAGEWLVPIPKPGTDMARAMVVNGTLKTHLREEIAERNRYFALADDLAGGVALNLDQALKTIADRERVIADLEAERDALAEDAAKYRDLCH